MLGPKNDKTLPGRCEQVDWRTSPPKRPSKPYFGSLSMGYGIPEADLECLRRQTDIPRFHQGE